MLRHHKNLFSYLEIFIVLDPIQISIHCLHVIKLLFERSIEVKMYTKLNARNYYNFEAFSCIADKGLTWWKFKIKFFWYYTMFWKTRWSGCRSTSVLKNWNTGVDLLITYSFHPIIFHRTPSTFHFGIAILLELWEINKDTINRRL